MWYRNNGIPNWNRLHEPSFQLETAKRVVRELVKFVKFEFYYFIYFQI